MSKTISCQSWQPETAAVRGGALKDPLNSKTLPTICSNKVLVLIPALLSTSSPWGSSGTFAGMEIFLFLSTLCSLVSPSEWLCFNPFLLSQIQSFSAE